MEGTTFVSLGTTTELTTLVGPGFTSLIGDVNMSFDVGDGRLAKLLSQS